MRSAFLLLVVAACAAPGAADEDPTTAGSDLVGGTHDLRWESSGYLTKGDGKVACGATLIAPNVVVTAAHCALHDDAALLFGRGDPSRVNLVKVTERHAHPEFHARPDGMIDIPYILRKNDVAYLILEKPILDTKPAALPSTAATDECNVQAIGYHGGVRTSAPACVLFKVSLGDDPIFEVHPANGSGLCNADGDEGSPVVNRATGMLTGIYVGSITQSVTDCRGYVQFADGYESAFGYRSFFQQGIDRGRSLAP